VLLPVILVLFTVVLVVIELCLRSLSNPQRKAIEQKKRRESARFDDFDVIKSIPPHKSAAYLTPEFWEEMQFFTNHGSAEKIKLPNGNLVVNARNFDGKHISAKDGMRTTTDAPDNPTGRVLLLGGSTVYCFEVPDSLTIASYLQRFLNSSDSTLQVLNLGVSGVTAINRIEKLKSLGTLEQNDIVVILFGDNDVGWQHYYLHEPFLLKVIRNLRKYSRLLAWIYFELSTQRKIKAGITAANKTAARLNQLSLHLNSINVRHNFVIQPNIYTKKSLNMYESEIVNRFGVDFSQIIKSAYGFYGQLRNLPFVSATHLMDDTDESVYLDWSHTNAAGNELLAKFISQLELFKNDQTY
jgi:lysophospholipase L1-like esterase